jgi:hypothetical protein
MYSAIPIVSRQRLASIQAEAVSILIVRQRLTLARNKITDREYPLQGEIPLVESQTDAMSQAEPAKCANLVVTTSSGHFQRCANPFCNADIEPMNHGRWRRTQRRFCSDACKYDYHALRRVKALLNRVGVIEFQRLLRGV